VKLTIRNAIAIPCILVIVFVSLQYIQHRHDERPLSVFHQIGAVGYPEEISTGQAAIRIKPMELPIRFKVGLVDSTIQSHHYCVELRWGERVRCSFDSSKPIDFMIVFSDEKWPDIGYLGSGDVVVANETSISSYGVSSWLVWGVTSASTSTGAGARSIHRKPRSSVLKGLICGRLDEGSRKKPKNVPSGPLFPRNSPETLHRGVMEDQLASPHGGSTLITWAPMSVRSMVQKGPARCWVRSMILIP